VLHGTDRDGSDLDLLVEALPGATLLNLGDLEDAQKNLLGIDVDVRAPGDLPPKSRAKVLAEAQPVRTRIIDFLGVYCLGAACAIAWSMAGSKLISFCC